VNYMSGPNEVLYHEIIQAIYKVAEAVQSGGEVEKGVVVAQCMDAVNAYESSGEAMIRVTEADLRDSVEAEEQRQRQLMKGLEEVANFLGG